MPRSWQGKEGSRLCFYTKIMHPWDAGVPQRKFCRSVLRKSSWGRWERDSQRMFPAVREAIPSYHLLIKADPLNEASQNYLAKLIGHVSTVHKGGMLRSPSPPCQGHKVFHQHSDTICFHAELKYLLSSILGSARTCRFHGTQRTTRRCCMYSIFNILRWN